FIGLLGWHPKDDHEVFTRDYAVEHFEMSRVQQSGAIFNEEKLDFVNREHMRMMTPIELVTLATPFYEKAGVAIPTATDENYEMLQKAVALQLGRAKTLVDVVEGSKFFFALPEYEAKLLCWKE